MKETNTTHTHNTIFLFRDRNKGTTVRRGNIWGEGGPAAIKGKKGNANLPSFLPNLNFGWIFRGGEERKKGTGIGWATHLDWAQSWGVPG